MNLTITNNGQEDEAIGGGKYVDVLEPGVAKTIDNDEEVLIIGDKPSVRDQFKDAAMVLVESVKKVIDKILHRKEKCEQDGDSEQVEVAISNHGTNAVRVIMGDGVTDMVVSPGSTGSASAYGYLELRELGTLDDSQEDGGTQPAVA